MNDVEVLKRLAAPITKVYTESVLPPETGLEGVSVIILNNDFENTITCTFIHTEGTTVIPVPPNTAFESFVNAYKGITVSGSSSYFIYVKEIL